MLNLISEEGSAFEDSEREKRERETQVKKEKENAEKTKVVVSSVRKVGIGVLM